ncbi:NAD-dependent epimerase/dehydratase family protein [Candidatus Pelagibacter sp.]|jgi:UDP-glucuronate 4-epimerase|nr:NAD-dependent epimerase/dehydratase family protein [Candidatus Pelagibacter sp.]|tara:strand:- start:84 stop:1058 length:975 start_codon:yes stop_codon:yes gene_type:complete
MNYLVTGCAGFIGCHVVESILKKNNNSNVIGLDSINNYYSIKLKKERIKKLKKNKRFKFYKIDLSEKKDVIKVFKKFKIHIVIHLAAQAGVRYSVIKPLSYFESNVLGFQNIIDLSRKYEVKKFIFASSSSVYGDKKKYPLNEKEKIYPKNIYSASKKLNEDIAKDVSNISKMKIIGLRFFTIYGKWGRPDMFIFSLLKAAKEKKIYYLNNYGKHVRDFTHIDDVITIINKLIAKKINKNFQIFNICSNDPIKMNVLISEMQNYIKNKAIIKRVGHNKVEVFKTHGDNSKIKKYLNIKKFKNIITELKKIIDWYENEKIWKITN